MTNNVLTDDQIQQYRRDGFVAPVQVFSKEQAAEYAAMLEASEHKYPDQLSATNRNNPHLVLPFLDEIVHHPVVLGAVEDLIGPAFHLWGSVLFIKDPGSEHFVSWHQDATYMGIEPHDFVTPWIALTESNLETGCMSMIPGSHADNIQSHEDTYGEDNILTRGQRVNNVDESTAVHLILEPGQMSLHHARVVHGSQPNRSRSGRRIGYAVQGYMPAHSRQVIGENYWTRIRGEFPSEDFIELPRPDSAMAPGDIETREMVNSNWTRILYHGAQKTREY
ncbi:MAG: phytanoyl-CoA dioxygenase family protein [Pseudomonadota bacterium]